MADTSKRASERLDQVYEEPSSGPKLNQNEIENVGPWVRLVVPEQMQLQRSTFRTSAVDYTVSENSSRFGMVGIEAKAAAQTLHK